MPKKITDTTPFRPSRIFSAAPNGFFVRATIETVQEMLAPQWAIAHAWEPDGYEVMFSGKTTDLTEMIGQEVDIPGHAIIGYSGAVGAWGKARHRDPEDAPILVKGPMFPEPLMHRNDGSPI